MKYQIIIQPRAGREIEAAYRWIARRAPAGAARWFTGIQKAIESLALMPERCPLAPESDAFEEEIRQQLYGKRNNVYRILFVVRGATVSILCVRYAARPFLEQGSLDLNDPE